MAERKVGSQSVNLTPNHSKSGIALNYVCASNVPHIFEEGYNFSLDLALIGGHQKKLLTFKMAIVVLSGLLTSETWEK
jgi:hypothetical protein